MKSSKLNYFANCKTIDEVKALYKVLAKENHPDMGGSVEIMQAINAEYPIACKLVAHNSGMKNDEFEKAILDSEAYKNAIDAIIHLNGLVIECVGNWVWVTGETYTHKDTLKAAHFMFAGKKKAWYFRTEEYRVKRSTGMSLDSIKQKYGSQLISSKANYIHN